MDTLLSRLPHPVIPRNAVASVVVLLESTSAHLDYTVASLTSVIELLRTKRQVSRSDVVVVSLLQDELDTLVIRALRLRDTALNELGHTETTRAGWWNRIFPSRKLADRTEQLQLLAGTVDMVLGDLNGARNVIDAYGKPHGFMTREVLDMFVGELTTLHTVLTSRH